MAGELLLILHMRIKENLPGTRQQKDSSTYISEGNGINLNLQRVRSYINLNEGKRLCKPYKERIQLKTH